METQVFRLEEILVPGDAVPEGGWHLRAIKSDQCVSYVAWNQDTREAILIDPKREDLHAYQGILAELPNYRWVGVIDTHTHADHISAASELSDQLKTPLIMHALSPSRRVHLRVAKDTSLHAHAAPLQLLATPGHTPDSITALWGPFIFGGDTLLFGDTGRDDLPGGDPEAHFESLVKIKAAAAPEMILLPRHDHKPARASSWARQLKLNASLTQSRDEFVRDAAAFDAPAPKLLKESLRENFK